MNKYFRNSRKGSEIKRTGTETREQEFNVALQRYATTDGNDPPSTAPATGGGYRATDKARDHVRRMEKNLKNDPLGFEANTMNQGVLGSVLAANFDFTAGHTRTQSEVKGVKIRRYTKTKIDGTFDSLKNELTAFKDEKRPSVEQYAPSRARRNKVLDYVMNGTEVGKYSPKYMQTQAEVKTNYFVGRG